MKNYAVLIFCLFLSALLAAQQSPKKYLLIEHFTNSNCSTCASRNPGLFNLINQAQYADDVHHISIHPMFPYQQCVFYQANKPENTAWTALYPVSGTPTLVLNGATQNPSNPLLTAAKLQSFLNQTSPLALEVSETGTTDIRTVKVVATAFGDIPPGDYKIFVAVAEKTVNQVTPNGEAVHHNVFRKMLTAVAGDIFTLPAAGASTELNYTFTIPSTWVADEVYALAFVKEVNTKQILNSGTRFDPVLTSIGGANVTQLNILPNPSRDYARIDLTDDIAQSVSVYALNGKQISNSFEMQETGVSFITTHFSPGIYVVKIVGKKGVYAGKFVKE